MKIKCPHCGTEIEIEASVEPIKVKLAVQATSVMLDRQHTDAPPPLGINVSDGVIVGDRVGN